MHVGADHGAFFDYRARMDKGGLVNHGLSLPAAGTHHGCFADNLTVNGRHAFEASQAAASFLEGDFHDHLILAPQDA